MGEAAAPPRLVLASASPRRLELLARLGVRPEVRPTAVDETPRPDEPAATLVTRLARAKATARARRQDDEVVLAADTVVVLDHRAMGKPVDDDHARRMLRRLSGRPHDVLTAVAVARGATVHHEVVTTRVWFRDLTDTELDWYVATGEHRDKAGAYALQGAGSVLVDRIQGSDTAVIGLPLAATVALLRQVGLDLLA